MVFFFEFPGYCTSLFRVDSQCVVWPIPLLHQQTLGAAACLGVILVHVELSDVCATVGQATGARDSSHLAIVSSDLPDKAVERLLDVDFVLCRCLQEGGAKFV